MAEEDLQDDYFDSGLFEWLYVEDDYPLADELAETQIASPGYAGTKYEVDIESYDIDMFEYWDDLHYGEDEYWDNGGRGVPTAEAGQKRKRNEAKLGRHAQKRRKLNLKDTGGDNVRFVNVAARIARREPPILEQPTSFALLPDWKQRFAGDTGVIETQSMPEAMKKAAEGRDEDSPLKSRQAYASGVQGSDDGWEDEGDGDEDMEAQPASLDPEAIKAILKQRLGDAGLEGMDEGAFMRTITKMLSGEGGADEAADDLASSLLGQATQGNDTALSGWLSQQGVSLDAAEDEEGDETASVATPDFPQTSTVRHLQSVEISPPDSAIEVSRSTSGATSEMAIHPPSPSASAKKRAAPSEDQEGSKKRKKVTFDVPASSQLVQADDEDGDEITVAARSEVPDPPTSEDPLMSGTTLDNEDTRAAKTRGANTKTVKSNKHKSNGPKADAEQEDTADISEAAPARQTRKRKAQDDDDEIAVAAPTPKKQAKKASAPAAPSAGPPAKRTRSARPRFGK
ncbi:hypothetical protein LTR37_007374 [Vermiconidia calcicola]|uniref:Uncharacterized protein n=1 Tax=Vermiconidia calcicola TaxID=1690605 RepID=A0ACC3NDS7_9PEZI|nr:hypothetical protein LTR37_007374 [Vermiconidia calcicola]